MASYFCADCSWQGNGLACPLCGNVTECLDVEEYSGMPRETHEFGFATEVPEYDYNDADDDF